MNKKEREFVAKFSELLREYNVKVVIYQYSDDYGAGDYEGHKISGEDFDVNFSYLNDDVVEEL